MKQIIVIAFLFFALSFATFSQSTGSESKAIKISQYKKEHYSEEIKSAVFDLSEKLQSESKAEGIIKIQAKSSVGIIRQIHEVIGLLNFRGLNLNRVSFAIRTSDEEITQYWFVPLGADVHDCEDCIIIRAEDFHRLVEFFYPKPKLKKRKK
ncbi:MAG: hypothetical protein M3033_08655 [Acidobacteriota bacterium]|nr:hypothetical protein [Acidobacteriota bacterium]